LISEICYDSNFNYVYRTAKIDVKFFNFFACFFILFYRSSMYETFRA